MQSPQPKQKKSTDLRTIQNQTTGTMNLPSIKDKDLGTFKLNGFPQDETNVDLNEAI